MKELHFQSPIKSNQINWFSFLIWTYGACEIKWALNATYSVSFWYEKSFLTKDANKCCVWFSPKKRVNISHWAISVRHPGCAIIQNKYWTLNTMDRNGHNVKCIQITINIQLETIRLKRKQELLLWNAFINCKLIVNYICIIIIIQFLFYSNKEWKFF